MATHSVRLVTSANGRYFVADSGRGTDRGNLTSDQFRSAVSFATSVRPTDRFNNGLPQRPVYHGGRNRMACRSFAQLTSVNAFLRCAGIGPHLHLRHTDRRRRRTVSPTRGATVSVER
jgi:hypothetical protein